jgi:hypothetical protein
VTRCPLPTCQQPLVDEVDARLHAIDQHGGRNEDGLPNGRFIHEAIPGAKRTVCGLTMNDGKRDLWDNPLTDGGYAVAGHPTCVTCAACASVARSDGHIALG